MRSLEIASERIFLNLHIPVIFLTLAASPSNTSTPVMACPFCDSHWFWKKIGRCTQCMVQLTVLCLMFWPAWLFWAQTHLKEVGAIALLFFGVACHLLLVLHLLMKFVIIPGKRAAHKKEKP